MKTIISTAMPRVLALAGAAALLTTAAQAQDKLTEEDLLDLSDGQKQALENSASRLSDEAIGLQYDDMPERPQPLFEAGNPFMGFGAFADNLNVPGGGVFQPSTLIWGRYRTAYQGSGGSNAAGEVSEWVNRLDLFAETRLSGTERVIVGLRPLDEEGEFSGYDFREGEWTDGTGGDLIQVAFLEGDLGEILADADRDDSLPLDIGFAVGRQPIFFQDGVLINDVMDSVGVTKNSLRFWGFSNIRLTGLAAWNEVHRGTGVLDKDAFLVGFLAEADNENATMELDFVATNSEAGGDGLYAGFGSTQRIGGVNTTFRANGSMAGDAADGSINPVFVDDGVLVTAEVSITPYKTNDVMYWNTYAGFGAFRSAARGPATGTPLNRIGITYSATGIGSLIAPLGGQPDDSVGTAVGYQKIFAGGRQQLIYEAGARQTFDGGGALAGGVRYQRAFGQHTVFIVDLFAAADGRSLAEGGQDGNYVAGRFELLFKF